MEERNIREMKFEHEINHIKHAWMQNIKQGFDWKDFVWLWLVDDVVSLLGEPTPYIH